MQCCIPDIRIGSPEPRERKRTCRTKRGGSNCREDESSSRELLDGCSSKT
ncbi:unnamed protein product [Hymenolepis diminuta]|uniref:Uncharacterized protein n=1 Tax=Hymenolepis diminuta TaxID=6216 RepID=A0A564YEW6_HYMDI|nr:unnamed protein product [Hymenolepis diminuta]